MGEIIRSIIRRPTCKREGRKEGRMNTNHKIMEEIMKFEQLYTIMNNYWELERGRKKERKLYKMEDNTLMKRKCSAMGNDVHIRQEVSV